RTRREARQLAAMNFELRVWISLGDRFCRLPFLGRERGALDRCIGRRFRADPLHGHGGRGVSLPGKEERRQRIVAYRGRRRGSLCLLLSKQRRAKRQGGQATEGRCKEIATIHRIGGEMGERKRCNRGADREQSFNL